MEISVASWNQNQEQQIKDELDLINFQEQLSFENNDKLNNDGSQCQQANFQQDCSNQNQLQLTLDDQVNELIKQHKQKNDEIYASKKKKIIKVNTSHSRGEIKILKYLIKKYGWKEVWGLDGSVMWSGLSIPHDELAICFEINVNRIPEMHELTSKKVTGFYLNKFREYFPDEYDFYPRTFLLPENIDEFKEFHKQTKSQPLYISKPSGGAQGDGIKVFNKPSDINLSSYTPHANEMVVQQYIHNPLIMDKLKFDFRIFAMIASVDPLIVYLNDEGLVRFCTEEYQKPTSSNFKNSYMHLTNYSLNKDHPSFRLPQDGDDILGENSAHKRTLTSVFKQLQKSGFDVENIKEQIEQIIQKFIISMYPFILYNHKVCFKSKQSKCFHVIGFDIMLDDVGKPWLIEANANPSFNIEHEVYSSTVKSQMELSPLDKYIKGIVVGDAIMLIQKSIEKQKEIGVGGQYRSWKQILDGDFQETEQTQIFKKMLDIYGKLSGYNFKYNLSSGSFRKLADYLPPQSNLKKVDLELLFKKIIQNTFMDFYDFINALEIICQKIYPNEFDKKNKLPFMSQLIEHIKI